MPITRKRRGEESDNDESNGEGTFTSFVHKARWFVLSQTEGEDLQPRVTPEWEAKRALAALDIELIAFEGTEPIQQEERRHLGAEFPFRGFEP